jgi:hypothetical protein
VLSVIVALVLFFMVAIEVLGSRLKLGRSYLRRGLFGRERGSAGEASASRGASQGDAQGGSLNGAQDSAEGGTA